MSELQLVLNRLDEIGRKVDQNTQATNEVVTANAVLTERVAHVIEKMDGHLDADDEIHGEQGKAITSLNDWRTSLKAKIASYAAVAAFVWGVVFSLGKEALANIFHIGGGAP